MSAEARDLLITPFYAGDSWGTHDLRLTPTANPPSDTPTLEVGAVAHSQPAALTDLDVAVGPDALRQALILRLLTPLGGLASLGHRDYGSRLHELIGRTADNTARALARSYTLRALTADQRVEEVVALDVAKPDQLDQESIRIRAFVKAKEFDDPIELGIEVAL